MRKHIISNVAYLRQKIALECEALNQSLYGPAITATHAVVANRYRRLDRYYDELSQLVGEEAALTTLITTYNEKIK